MRVFKPTLQRVVEKVDGALGAAVLSLDGLVIEAVDQAGHAVAGSDALITYGPVFKQLLGIADAVDLGEIERFTVNAGARTHLVRVLDARYVAALTIDGDAIEGQGHFHLRVAAPDLAREL